MGGTGVADDHGMGAGKYPGQLRPAGPPAEIHADPACHQGGERPLVCSAGNDRAQPAEREFVDRLCAQFHGPAASRN